MLARDIMTKNVITVLENEPISKAAELMRQYDVGMLPVVEGEKVVGVVTDRDIVTRAISKGENSQGFKVSDCMSKSTVFANPTQSVEEVAKTMAAQQVRRVPVVENNKLCGILSLCDISKNGCDSEVSKALCEISKP